MLNLNLMMIEQSTHVFLVVGRLFFFMIFPSQSFSTVQHLKMRLPVRFSANLLHNLF